MDGSSFPDRQWKYDVFVSFRGEDIRKSFMDHILKEFERKGIKAFKDKKLPKGELISPELYKAIEESRFLIVIFSKNYASSSWCLRELVKILECKEKHEVRIIFYDVKPNVVRKQTESYAEAFAKHESLNKIEIAQWKEALSKAADLSGWDLQDDANGYEAAFIETICKEIINKLWDGPLHVVENLVGVDVHLKNLNLLRFVRLDKVYMFGICGISGIGKTTLAKAIYNSIHLYFKGSCFCADVQEVANRQGLIQVQMQLINKIMKSEDVKISTCDEGIMIIKQRLASMPILLVLDNVDHEHQLEALAGSHDWFAPGSLIIFTSKDKQLLRFHKVDEIHDMPFLSNQDAYELFCLRAFGHNHPTFDFKVLTYQVINHLQGHPLALKVIGRYLYKKPVAVWNSHLSRLQTFPYSEIQQKLRPSYDGLNSDEKTIFLDIAISLKGENKKFVMDVLDSSGLFPEASIEELVDKSLITISPDDMSLQMHELIQSMAREIAREESKIPGNLSRLWGPSEEVCEVLSEDKETGAIEVLVLLLEKSNRKFHLDSKVFTHMKKLRILKVCYQEPENSMKPEDMNVNFSGSLDYLSNKLRLLYWHGCPFKFFPANFYPENIVTIDLSYSNIKRLMTTPKCFARLKIMKLKYCRNLKSTPNFTGITNLKELILEGCVNLVEVHQSIGMLKELVVLNMKNCMRFKGFPCKVEMDSLQVLNLSGCSKVENLHEVLGSIKTLVELHLDGTALTNPPPYVFSLSNLHKRFRFRGWSKISYTISQPICLLQTLGGLCFLRFLNLSYCKILQIPEIIGDFSCLEVLNLNGNNFTSFPASLSRLSRLEKLEITDCKKLEVFPELPSSIRFLFASRSSILQVPENIGSLSRLETLNLNGNHFTTLPRSLHQLSNLIALFIDGCKKLEVLPELPSNTYRLHASHCTSLRELSGQLSFDSHITYFLSHCPQLFRNLTAESQELQPLYSHGSKGKLYSLLRFVGIQSDIYEFFYEGEKKSYPDEMKLMLFGNRIPPWFTNQSKGSQVKVELPPDWCYDKFQGYGICVVFTRKKFHGRLKLHVSNFDGARLDDSEDIGNIEHRSTRILDLDIMWLQYKSWDMRWKKAKHFVTFSFRGKNNEDVEVRECGVRLVCDQDITDGMNSSNFIQQLPNPTQDGGLFLRFMGTRTLGIEW